MGGNAAFHVFVTCLRCGDEQHAPTLTGKSLGKGALARTCATEDENEFLFQGFNPAMR